MDRGILVIAPGGNLKNVGDIVAAANGFRVMTLDGYVTAREALKEIGSGRYGIIHFGGHGDLDHLEMSDGKLDDEYLEMALRSGNVQLVILNSCESINMAARLYRAGVAPRVIGWSQECVEDKMAIDWVIAFYRSLAMGVDFWEAYMNSVAVMKGADAGFKAPVYLNGRIVLLEQRVAGIQEQLDNLAGKAIVPHWLIGLTMLLLLALAALVVVV